MTPQPLLWLSEPLRGRGRWVPGGALQCQSGVRAGLCATAVPILSALLAAVAAAYGNVRHSETRHRLVARSRNASEQTLRLLNGGNKEKGVLERLRPLVLSHDVLS